MAHLVGIAGAMASGKTSVATAAARILGVEVLSFGGLVRAEVLSRGLAAGREALQEMGQAMAIGDPAGMVARLLSGRRSDVVVEGIRHLGVLAALREVAPDMVFIYLAATPADIAGHWEERGDDDDYGEVARHAVESEVPLLRSEATLVLNGSRLSVEAAAQIVAASARTI